LSVFTIVPVIRGYTMRSIIVAVLIAFSFVVIPSAAAGTIGIYADANGDSKCINGPVFDVYVVYTGTLAIQGMKFSMPFPYCADLLILSEDPVFPNTIGSALSGVEVAFGECLSGPIHVMTVRVFMLDLYEYCCAWWPEEVTVWDCNGNERYVSKAPVWLTTVQCGFTPPHSPVPEDSATNVPLTVDLEWDGRGFAGCDLGDALIYILYLGTDPDSLVMHWDVGPPYTAGELLPDTRYHWQVVGTTYNGGGPSPGPVWTFTTTDSVTPVNQNTWGRIKSLFR
jgi:hypothetical protein